MVVSVVLMAPYLSVCTNTAMLSLIKYSTILWILSISSLDVELCDIFGMLQLLKETNTGKYMQYWTGL